MPPIAMSLSFPFFFFFFFTHLSTIFRSLRFRRDCRDNHQESSRKDISSDVTTRNLLGTLYPKLDVRRKGGKRESFSRRNVSLVRRRDRAHRMRPYLRTRISIYTRTNTPCYDFLLVPPRVTCPVKPRALRFVLNRYDYFETRADTLKLTSIFKAIVNDIFYIHDCQRCAPFNLDTALAAATAGVRPAGLCARFVRS